MALWRRFQELQQRLLVLQGDINKLEKDNAECGRKTYELYKASSAGLDGEIPKQSTIDNE